MKWHPLKFKGYFYIYYMELNIKNTFQLLKDFVIPASAVFLFTSPVPH